MLQYNTGYIDNKAVIGILRRACGCVDKRLVDHGIRVSYLVFRLMRNLPDISPATLRDLCFLAALHDIGAYKTEEIDKMVQFETDEVWDHSVYGCLFVKHFSPLSALAPAVLYHHMPWNELRRNADVSDSLKHAAQLIFLADRLDIWMNMEGRSYPAFREHALAERDIRFESPLVDLLLMETFAPFTAEEIESDPGFQQMQSGVPFTHEEIYAYLTMVIYSIDFRSRHTVTHTMTTTSISYELATRAGVDAESCNQIVCGALLHDLGKIAIPVEILEFPGKLSPQAMTVMRTHVDITAGILGEEIPLPIRRIALCHHEKLNGTGYPKALRAGDLGVGERIVALADIVSALAGTRSYKEAFGKERILSIVSKMRADGLIDPALVDCMFDHYDAIMDNTAQRCQPVLEVYGNLLTEYEALYTRFAGSAPGP